jgi:3-phenylpropionate/trans-cinnamate dioxygenase ferredoxin subunit
MTQSIPTRTRKVVCKVTDLPPGERKLVDVGNRQIGIFNVQGSLYALRNTCPHHMAPVCLGQIGSAMVGSAPGDFQIEQEGAVLRCPWHRFRYDIRTGRSLQAPERYRIATYDVRTEGDEVILYA